MAALKYSLGASCSQNMLEFSDALLSIMEISSEHTHYSSFQWSLNLIRMIIVTLEIKIITFSLILVYQSFQPNGIMQKISTNC